MAKKKASKAKTTKKKKQREIPKQGRAYIVASFNNTIITITDPEGNPIYQSSSGKVGFRGTKKSTPYAAAQVGMEVAQVAREKGMEAIKVLIKGPGLGRNQAVKSLKQGGLDILSLADITPIPHNGCRPRKKRRV